MKAGYLIILLTIAMITSCERKGEEPLKGPPISKEVADSIANAKEIAKYDTFPKINYTKLQISDWRHFNQILRDRNMSSDDPKVQKVLMAMNRKEMRFFGKGDSIIVPDRIVEDLRAYSVFPQYYPDAKDLKKLLIVTNRLQAYACYEFGKLVRFSAANTGKERTPTFPGRYALIWKKRLHHSSIDSGWVMPFTWNFSEAGNALHKFVMPGRPVSHSCVRQFMSDAEWLYNWGEGIKRDTNGKLIPLSGTPVILIDIFDFSRKRYGPWIDLPSNKDGRIDLPKKPMEIEEALIPWCQVPDDAKYTIRNREKLIHAEDTLRARGIIRPGVNLIKTVNFNKLRRQRAAHEARIKLEKEKKNSIGTPIKTSPFDN